MSNCIPTATASAPAAVAGETPSSSLRPSHGRLHHSSPSNLFFSLSSKPNLRLFSQSTHSALTHTMAVRAQLNNVGMDGSSSAAAPQSKSDEIKNGKPSRESVSAPLGTEESISEFITQVSSLVRLVDSRDIVELQLKQHDCELLIRKKEAIEQTSPAPVIMMQSPPPPGVAPSATPSVSAPVAAPSGSPPPAPPAPKPAKSSVPPLKSPMAGTFYRSPAPGAPPFVKVGDKVQKGQVLCIIEAMKLMNEIEADQSGTVIEILAEDGKPVSLDSPLFAIQP